MNVKNEMPAGDAIKELVEDYANEMACESTSTTDSGPDIEVARKKLYAAIDALTGSPSVLVTPVGELSDEQISEIFSAPPHLRKTLNAAARAVIAADRALQPRAAPADVGDDGWPKLEKPAALLEHGGATFGKGVSARLLVDACYRHHERTQEARARTPDQRREDEIRRRAGWDLFDGGAAVVLAPKPPMPVIWVGALDDALVRQADAQAALAAKDADYAHGVALLNMRIKDLTAERDALATQVKPGTQAAPTLLTDAKISEIVGNNDDAWGHLDGAGIAREVEAAVHAANQALGSEGGAA